MSLSSLLLDERQVIGALLNSAFSRGLVCSVYDGEEWALDRSSDRAAIEALIGATGETLLRFRDGAPFPDPNFSRVVGQVYLVHGNGCDVLADWTDSDEMTALLAPALAVSDLVSRLA